MSSQRSTERTSVRLLGPLRVAALLLIAAIAVACGGRNSPTVGFLYAAGTDSLTAFAIRPERGALLPLSGFPVSTGHDSAPRLAVHPFGHFLAASTTSGIRVYRVDQRTGILTEAPGGPFGNRELPMLFHPGGGFVLGLQPFTGFLSVFRLDPTTGSLTEPNPPVRVPGSALNVMAFSANGNFLFISDNFNQALSVFAFDASTGALTVVDDHLAIGFTTSDMLAIGDFLYLAVPRQASAIAVYAIDRVAGSLSPVAGSPFTVNGFPTAMVAHPTGRFLYTANPGIGGDNIAAFALNPATGALSTIAGSPYSAEAGPGALAIVSSGQFLYAANFDSGDISGFLINPATGELTVIPYDPSPVSGSPGSIVVVPRLTPSQECRGVGDTHLPSGRDDPWSLLPKKSAAGSLRRLS
jgi:6-phosphogluconolactonase